MRARIVRDTRWCALRGAAALLATYSALVTCAGAQESSAAWAVLDRVLEAYRDVYDLRFEYDAWVDFGQDGSIEQTTTGSFLFRLRERTYRWEERHQRGDGAPEIHAIQSLLRGSYNLYTKYADAVQGTLHRGSKHDIWTWGAGVISPLLDPLLIDRSRCIAFLLGQERIGLRKCAHVVVIPRGYVTERRYQELKAMAARGEVPDDRLGHNYWIDTARGTVLRYETVALGLGPDNSRRPITTLITRATEVRQFRQDGAEIWLAVEAENVCMPMRRGNAVVVPGYIERIVIVPDSVQINPRAPDEAYVIEPPPGTRLQEEGDDTRVPPDPEAPAAESIPDLVGVTDRMIEEAERQLGEEGLAVVAPRRGGVWRWAVLAAGVVLIVVGLWLRKASVG